MTVSGNQGSIQVVDQNASVVNPGSASANTGGNIAIGNASSNSAAHRQGDGAVPDVARTSSSSSPSTQVNSNSGTASNTSDGSATIHTGDATATGNDSSTDINQDATADSSGELGSISVVRQDG